MTEVPYNEQRRLLSAAHELMSDIQDHTKSMQTALNLVRSEQSESFHAGEIVNDVIMLEMILEEFQGNVPEQFEPIKRFVEQRQKAYSETMGSDFYFNRRKRLEEELSDVASVPEPTEAEKEYTRKAARMVTRRHDKPERKQKEPEQPQLEHTGKVVRIYSLEAQDQIFNFEEKKTARPLEARLDPSDALFSELPEHYTIVCVERDQQLQVDTLQTLNANPFYRQDAAVEKAMQAAAVSGKNLFRLQQLYDALKKAAEKSSEAKGERDGR